MYKLKEITCYCCRPQSGGARKRGAPDLKGPIESLPELMHVCEGKPDALHAMLDAELTYNQVDQVRNTSYQQTTTRGPPRS